MAQDKEIIYVDQNGLVANVIVMSDDADPGDWLELYGYAEWFDRAEVPYVSVHWERINGEWVPPRPYPSWSWDGDDWVAPVPKPTPGEWTWNEETQEWVEVPEPPA